MCDKENSSESLYCDPLSLQIYPYLVLNDSQVSQCRSEERMLQLFSLLNRSLEKNKVCYYMYQKPKILIGNPN